MAEFAVSEEFVTDTNACILPSSLRIAVVMAIAGYL
jgi:hypothetical protein